VNLEKGFSGCVLGTNQNSHHHIYQSPNLELFSIGEVVTSYDNKFLISFKAMKDTNYNNY